MHGPMNVKCVCVYACVCVGGRDTKWHKILIFAINGQIFAHFKHNPGNNFRSKNFSQSPPQ